jgi:hypothetical protein
MPPALFVSVILGIGSPIIVLRESYYANAINHPTVTTVNSLQCLKMTQKVKTTREQAEAKV